MTPGILKIMNRVYPLKSFAPCMELEMDGPGFFVLFLKQRFSRRGSREAWYLFNRLYKEEGRGGMQIEEKKQS